MTGLASEDFRFMPFTFEDCSRISSGAGRAGSFEAMLAVNTRPNKVRNEVSNEE